MQAPQLVAQLRDGRGVCAHGEPWQDDYLLSSYEDS